MLEEKPNDGNVDDQLKLLLQEAGLESVPIDPTSLEALKSYVAGDNSHASAPEESSTVKATTDENRPPSIYSSHTNPPMSEVEPHPALRRFTSELTSPSADSMVSATEESSVAVVGPFVNAEGASPVENQILEQLHRQTRLLLEMQRRIDDLTATVDHLTRGGVASGIPSRRSPPAQASYSAPPMAWDPNAYPARTPMTARAPLPTAPAPQPPAQPRMAAAAPVQQPRNNAPGGGGMLMAIRNSKIFKIAHLFWALRRRHVQELDGGLIFKIVFMMAILTARMSSSGKSKHGDPDWHTKFAGLTILVMVGFLMQTGYLAYFYHFFVKENYPDRIFNGEDVNEIIRNPNGRNNPNNPQDNNNNQAARPGAPPLPRGQAPPNHPPRAGGADAGGWRNTFLGGMIPQADQGGVAGAFQDVALLFGSFLMSIFPMWQPEGPPQRRAAPAQPQQEQGPAPGGLAAGPGAVRPPRDAMQPADDSDDEDGN